MRPESTMGMLSSRNIRPSNCFSSTDLVSLKCREKVAEGATVQPCGSV